MSISKQHQNPYYRKVLIVDDQTMDIMLPHMLTSNMGMDVSICLDGEWGLRMAQKQSFELIILDWNMPVMNGLEFLRTLNRSVDGKVNIVLHTGQDIDLSEIESLDKIKILDVWRKPMSPQQMLRRIKSQNILRRSA